jgi:hypothetical protein
MAQDANHLVWLDMEMTGLEPERDRIIELAMIVTDSQLTTDRRITGVGRAPGGCLSCGDGRVESENACALRPDRAGPGISARRGGC